MDCSLTGIDVPFILKGLAFEHLLCNKIIIIIIAKKKQRRKKPPRQSLTTTMARF
jgi:hypothetical protein